MLDVAFGEQHPARTLADLVRGLEEDPHEVAVSSAGSHVPSGVSGSSTPRVRHLSEANTATRTKASTMRRSFFTSWTIAVPNLRSTSGWRR